MVSNSTSSAGELLSSGRLEALLRGMEDSLSASNSASSSSMRVMGTQKQQAALGRLRQSLPLLQLIGINFLDFPYFSTNSVKSSRMYGLSKARIFSAQNPVRHFSQSGTSLLSVPCGIKLR